jgi:ribosomal-protein-serine acetyltransferase
MIRILEHSDSKEMFTLVDNNREYLRKWFDWVDLKKTEKDIKSLIRSSLLLYAEEQSYFYVIIEEEKIIGLVELFNIDKLLNAAYIGYWIGEKYQGKGYVTKAVKDLLKIGFTELNLNKIEIKVVEENIKSRNIPEKLGFINTGVIRDSGLLHGKYVSHVLYSLLRDEYEG